MNHPAIKAALLGAAFICTTTAALAQAKPKAPVDLGALEHRSSCAVCHGLSGKGDGPGSRALKERPTDLTTLAKENRGVFPAQHIYEVIDGRKEVPSHGTRDMPIWGTHYLDEATFQYRYTEGMGSHGYEALVRARIVALLDYLNRIQVK
jgi:mono/diheme cytochrome c family protein